MMDVIFLSSNEPERFENYERACAVFKKTLKHVEGKPSLLEAFKEAALISETPLFALIDGDNEVYDHAPEIIGGINKPTIFQAENYLGMSYGHGGIKVLSRDFDWDHFENQALDISYHLNLEPSAECLSYHKFEAYPFHHFKTVFKELLKLHLKKGKGAFFNKLIKSWLCDPRNGAIYDEVKDYLKKAKFDSLRVDNLNRYLKGYFLETFDICLTAILGNDHKWVEGFSSVIDQFDHSFVLDTGSKDGSWKKLKELAQKNPKLKIKRKRFWRRDFSLFRNSCLNFSRLTQDQTRRRLYVVIDFDERVEHFDKKELLSEVFFSSKRGARFEVERKEWHGAVTHIPRVFFDSPGLWDGPIHETFWYKNDQLNYLNRIQSLKLSHEKSESKDLKIKGKRDFKILRKCVKANPKRYLYFIFESLNKMGDHKKVISEYDANKDFIKNHISLHFQLLIHKYVIMAYSDSNREPPLELVEFMKQFPFQSVYFQLVKALMSCEKNRDLCRELWKEMENFPPVVNEKDSGPIYIAEAYDKKELERVKNNLYN